MGVWQNQEVEQVSQQLRLRGSRNLSSTAAFLLLALVCAVVASTRGFDSLMEERGRLVGLDLPMTRLVVAGLGVFFAVLFIFSVGTFAAKYRPLAMGDAKSLLGAEIEGNEKKSDAKDSALHHEPRLKSHLMPSPFVASPNSKLTMSTPLKSTIGLSSARTALFSPSSPVVRSPMSGIRDERDLYSYFEQNFTDSPSGMNSHSRGLSSNSNGNSSGILGGISQSLFGYQTTYKAGASSQEDATFKDSEEAKKLLQRLNIELSMHSEWPYRLRRWISGELVEKCVVLADELKNRQNLLSRTARQEYESGQKKRMQQTQASQNQASQNSWGTSAFSGGTENAWSGFSGSTGNEEQHRLAAQQQAEVIIAKRHDLLQRYLDVTQDRACKEYVLDRLRQLMDGGTLSAYEWNGGGKWRGRDWNRDLPTDSQIILHLFVTKMNSLLARQARESGMQVGQTPFSNRYVLITPQRPDSKNKDVLIWLQRRNPAHVKVVVRNQIWETQPGGNNLYHALLLYIYAVAKEERGVVEMMSFQQSCPELLAVVRERKY